MRGGFLAVLILLGLLNGSGPAGGSALAEGRAADCVSWVCSRGWLVCLVIGVGNTPVMLLLPACVGSVWLGLADAAAARSACRQPGGRGHRRGRQRIGELPRLSPRGSLRVRVDWRGLVATHFLPRGSHGRRRRCPPSAGTHTYGTRTWVAIRTPHSPRVTA